MMEREINTHAGSYLNDRIKVSAIGEPGPGGASMKYRVCVPMRNPAERYPEENSRLARTYCDINFQNGSPSEQINGISGEALLAVLIDRMQGFQSGPFACVENQNALDHLKEAMYWLQHRTVERIERGVEGTQTP